MDDDFEATSGSPLFSPGVRRVLFAAAVLVFFTACEADGCDIDGFEAEKFPEEHADQSMAHSAEVRVTSHAFDFVEGQVDNLIDEFMDDGLSFCIPEDDDGDPEICHEEGVTCDDGSPGCQVDLEIEDVELIPEPAQTSGDTHKLIAHVVIGGLYKDEDIPITQESLLTSYDCWVDLFSADDDSEPASIPVQVPVHFDVEERSFFDDVRVDIGDVEADILNHVDFNIHGRGGTGDDIGCNVGGWVADVFLEGMLEDMIADEIDDMTEEMSRELLCRHCGEDEMDCPSNSTCYEPDDEDEPKVCEYGEDDCVPLLLGLEGQLALEELVGDFVAGGGEDLFLTGRVAERVEANTGLTMSATLGLEPDATSHCVPLDNAERPSFEAPEPADWINLDEDPDGDPFMFGVGIHRRMLDHVLWGLWASGGLCAEVGYDQSEFLTTSTFGALVESIDDIATRTAPIALRLSPQQPIDFELGDNEVEDGEVVDGLLTIDWSDLDIHVYGFVQERYARLFTMRIDLEIPVAVVPDGDNAIAPVIGDFEEAIDNIRVFDDAIVDADQEELEELIPMLVGVAVPQLLDDISDPIDLPEVFSYRLVVDDGDIRSIDDEYLALFLDLEYIGDEDDEDGEDLLVGSDLVVADKQLRVDDEDALPSVSVDLQFAGRSDEPIDVLYRLDGGTWRAAGTTPEITIDDPVLTLQGEHRLELRAIHPGERVHFAPDPIAVDITVDYEPPQLRVWQQGDVLHVEATDLVDDADDLQMRHRFADGDRPQDWSSWGDVESIELGELPGDDVTADVQVRDRAGHVAEKRVELQTGDTASDVDADDPPKGLLGCSATGGVGGTALGILAVLLVLLAIRNRRRTAGLVAVSGMALLLASGCGGCSETGGTDTQQNDDECPEDCAEGEVCEDGECVTPSCSDRDDCGALDCDGADQIPLCDNGECRCGDACTEECETDEFCCHDTRSCQAYPDWCADQECDDGYEPEITDIGKADPQTCEVTGGECECVTMDPIPLRYHGSYLSLDAGPDLTAVAVHNIDYGDLMIAEIDGDEIADWYFVDGVPDDGVIDGDPTGYRNGLITPGAEVGTHTATAVDADNRIHVFYRHEDDDTLKYARGERNGDGLEFELAVVEDDVDTGYYTEVLYRDGTLEVVYTARPDDESSEIRHRAIDADTPVDDIGDGDFDVLHTGSTEPAELEDYPGVAGLFLDLVEDDDGDLFLSFYDNTIQQIGWLTEGQPEDGEDDNGDNDNGDNDNGDNDNGDNDNGDNDNGEEDDELEPAWGPAEFFDADDIGAYAAVHPGGDDRLHIAYMDMREQGLFYDVVDGDDGDDTREWVVDGIRDTEAGWSQSPVGHDVQLFVDGDDVVLYYHDASTHQLRRATRDGEDDWSLETLAGEAGEPSPGHGLFVRGLDVDGQRLIVDFTVDTTVEDPEGYPSVRVD